MKTSLIFYTGLAIDALLLVSSVSSIFLMRSPLIGSDAHLAEGLSGVGKLMMWLIPMLLATLIGIACWLKKTGKLLPANVLLWIPALPVLAGIILWGGLAILFIIAGAGK